MSETVSPSADRAYGLARVCRVWGVARSTIYAQRHQQPASERRRPGPIGPASDDELADTIRQVIASAPFHGEGHRKIHMRLRHQGVRTSRRRVRRIMREHGLRSPDRPTPRPANEHDGSITTTDVDTRWGTDMTQTTLATGAKAQVFLAVDHCNTECVGIHAAFSGNRWEALEPVRQGVRRHFGPAAPDIAAGLTLRHDHGSNYMADDFQREIKFLGITPSPSFVREPEGNGVAERFIRTLKEQLLWLETFETIEELQEALKAFRDWFNTQWLLQRHGHQTPAEVRDQQTAHALAHEPIAMAA